MPQDESNEGDEILASGRHLEFLRRKGWEYARRPGIKGVVAVVAITEDQQLILTEQLRPPVNRSVIELPAGLAGDIPLQEDEPLASAAARELYEETGYRAAKMTRLVEGPSSAGMSDEIITFFAASGLQRVSDGGGRGRESIRVHHVPVREVPDWCKDRSTEGTMVDFKIYAGLYLVKGMDLQGDRRGRLWY